jgi:hypothetical protein
VDRVNSRQLGRGIEVFATIPGTERKTETRWRRELDSNSQVLYTQKQRFLARKSQLVSKSLIAEKVKRNFGRKLLRCPQRRAGRVFTKYVRYFWLP